MEFKVDSANEMSRVYFGFMPMINRTNALREGKLNRICNARKIRHLIRRLIVAS